MQHNDYVKSHVFLIITDRRKITYAADGRSNLLFVIWHKWM